MNISDEAQFFAIQVEKQLCAVLARKWSPTGMSIETLIADIDKELIRLRQICRDANEVWPTDINMTTASDNERRLLDALIRMKSEVKKGLKK